MRLAVGKNFARNRPAEEIGQRKQEGPDIVLVHHGAADPVLPLQLDLQSQGFVIQIAIWTFEL